MQQWFRKTIDKYTKQIILFCVLLIFILGVYNFITKKKGTYTNHDELIKTLFEIPFNKDVKNQNGFEKITNDFQSQGEIECKKSIEDITKKPFYKCRPDFLKNEITGKNLELDCYNHDLKIAIEYNGIQHYEYTPIFHKTKDAFYNTKYRDKIKKELCKKEGIKLIIVPYDVKLKDIKNFILQKL